MQFLQASLSSCDISGGAQNGVKSLAGLHDVKPENDSDDGDDSDSNWASEQPLYITKPNNRVINWYSDLLGNFDYYIKLTQ